MIINDEGNYTLRYTATDSCGNSTVVDRELVVEAQPYYGAVWDGSDDPQWTRTGASANFADPQPAVANGTGSSPFDNIMPWSGMQIVEDADVGTLVSIPKFWYKWVRDELNEGSMELRIANEPLDGFFVSPAHADRGDGVGERDVVYVGRYHCSSTNYKSTSGASPKGAESRGSFRTSIHALGSDIWQYDFAMYWTIAMLYLIEFAHWNSQDKIGYGCGSGSTKGNEGATDAMQYHTGTNAATRDTYGEVQYRHIEGLWSNVRDWVDGIYFNDADVYAIKNPTEFSDGSGGVLVGTRAAVSGTPISFISPSINGYEYFLYPNSSANSGYVVRTCDNCHYYASGVVLSVGGAYNGKDTSYGLFFLHGYYGATSTSLYVGSRLMKLPSA